MSSLELPRNSEQETNLIPYERKLQRDTEKMMSIWGRYENIQEIREEDQEHINPVSTLTAPVPRS
jgi:hypothetical protein